MKQPTFTSPQQMFNSRYYTCRFHE